MTAPFRGFSPPLVLTHHAGQTHRPAARAASALGTGSRTGPPGRDWPGPSAGPSGHLAHPVRTRAGHTQDPGWFINRSQNITLNAQTIQARPQAHELRNPPGAAGALWWFVPSGYRVLLAPWKTRGRARAAITRRLCTIAGYYRYAVDEELLDHSPGRSCPSSPPQSRITRHWARRQRARRSFVEGAVP